LFLDGKFFSSLLILSGCVGFFHICKLWYIGSYTIIAKPIKSLDLDY